MDIIKLMGKYDHQPLTYLWKTEHEYHKLAGGPKSERWEILAKEHGNGHFKGIENPAF